MFSEGASLAHFRVLSRLGAGGMGEVYLAQDTKLGRKVALKILSPDLTRRPDRLLRFEQEARTASALNHPNIITIFDIGQDADTRFIATEYIEGETLRGRLARGRLPVREALETAIQIAAALTEAHGAGIVHRDIKPENIMLRPNGLVKVLDFGLAKLTESTTTPSSDAATATVVAFDTEPGQVAGTPFYMSPEQARGLKVDARTDVFSLGVVLYEMLAGRRPFEGETSSHAMVAILEKEPLPLERYVPEIPPELQRILSKALEKDRDERYQVVKDLYLDLKRLAGQTTATPAATIAPPRPASRIPRFRKPAIASAAVLALTGAAVFAWLHRAPAITSRDAILITDFVNSTGDSVFDGTLKQGLAAQLEQSPYLNLVPDQRVHETLRLMGRAPEERITPDIGREICQREGVKALIESSIAPLGTHYVLTLAAVNAATGEDLARLQMEAESKERVLHTLGAAATELRRKLGESLGSIQKYDVPLPQATTSSLEALKAFAISRQKNQATDFTESIRYCLRAVELDPNFATAWRGLAVNYGNNFDRARSVEAATKAYELRNRASEMERLQIESDYFHIVTGELERSAEALEAVVQTYPREFSSWNNLGLEYQDLGELDKAVNAYRKSLEIQPTAIASGNLAGTFMRLNRLPEARETCKQAAGRQMDSVACHNNLFNVAFLTGDEAGMKAQFDWARSTNHAARISAWERHVADARGQLRRVREMAETEAQNQLRRDAKEGLSGNLSGLAVDEALWGRCREAVSDARRALDAAKPTGGLMSAATAYAYCGDSAALTTIEDGLLKQRPKATGIAASAACLSALAQSRRGHPPASVAEFRMPVPVGPGGLPLVYCRAEVLLAARQPADAAPLYQRIVDRAGWSAGSPLYLAARLGLARAAVQSGETEKSRKLYQDFFALMKDADQDLPLLLDARREYEKLK